MTTINQVLAEIATRLFKDVAKNNYIENTVCVHNDGDTLRIEILCVNEYGGRYSIFPHSKVVGIGEIPEELRSELPHVGDWMDYDYDY